ncbi:hypothetical protein B7494_g5193 [Chlorociboria aeruginascens]|nr:hypothetical protein B7494_g5193 [Chlorociboria aeruginascens]
MFSLTASLVTILAGGLHVTSALSLDATNTTSIQACSKAVASNLLKSWYTFDNTDHSQVGIFNLVSWEWWLSGGAWTAFQDYQSYTGDTEWQATTLAAIGEQAGPNYDFLPPWEFSSEANDDQAYWVFNALTALEYGFPILQCPSGQRPGNCSNSYLKIANNAFNEYVARWESTGVTTCNGGLKWQFTDAVSGYYYKNTVSNGGFFQLAARLARYTGNSTYSTWANTVWDWTEGVGFINADYNVYDGAGDNNGANCTVIDTDQWTYNIGSYMMGAASMYNYTNGSAKWSDRVGGLLNTSISNYFQMPSAPGVIYESVWVFSPLDGKDQHFGTNALRPNYAAAPDFGYSSRPGLCWSKLYSVWPVLDSNYLINRLQTSSEDIEAYVLALALSSATSSQLQLSVIGPDSNITAAYLATESVRIRSTYDFREKPTYYATLVPFFLHVHYATLLKFRSSMMFLQEAISFAKLFEMELDNGVDIGDQSKNDDLHTLFCLLWVTERGYAFQGNFSALSAGRSIPTNSSPLPDLNPHKRDLLHLANLFAAFELEPMRSLPSHHPNEASLEQLQILQQRLTEAPDYLSDLGGTSYVDYIVTQQWMRTILWQKSMSQGYLSFNSAIECMRYNYPVRIMRDLLNSIPQIERETIVAGKKISDIYLKSRLKNIGAGGDSEDFELVDGMTEEAVNNG